eukprot:31198-Pelagococcus_subviridis.AAC.13
MPLLRGPPPEHLFSVLVVDVHVVLRRVRERVVHELARRRVVLVRRRAPVLLVVVAVLPFGVRRARADGRRRVRRRDREPRRLGRRLLRLLEKVRPAVDPWLRRDEVIELLVPAQVLQRHRVQQRQEVDEPRDERLAAVVPDEPPFPPRPPRRAVARREAVERDAHHDDVRPEREREREREREIERERERTSRESIRSRRHFKSERGASDDDDGGTTAGTHHFDPMSSTFRVVRAQDDEEPDHERVNLERVRVKKRRSERILDVVHADAHRGDDDAEDPERKRARERRAVRAQEQGKAPEPLPVVKHRGAPSGVRRSGAGRCENHHAAGGAEFCCTAKKR